MLSLWDPGQTASQVQAPLQVTVIPPPLGKHPLLLAGKHLLPASLRRQEDHPPPPPPPPPAPLLHLSIPAPWPADPTYFPEPQISHLSEVLDEAL